MQLKKTPKQHVETPHCLYPDTNNGIILQNHSTSHPGHWQPHSQDTKHFHHHKEPSCTSGSLLNAVKPTLKPWQPVICSPFHNFVTERMLCKRNHTRRNLWGLAVSCSIILAETAAHTSSLRCPVVSVAWTDHSLTTEGHPGCFQFLAIWNKST